MNFLSTLTGSFARPAAENPTVAMVEAAYRRLGIDGRYLNCEVAPEALGDAVRGAKAMGWAGFNCSIPHKVAVLEHLDGLGESAALIGAVNCAVRRDGKWQLGKFDEYPGQPAEHGCDEYCMWTWVYGGRKSSRYYAPETYRDGKVSRGSRTDFGPDIFNDFVLDFIDRKKDRPFFIYFPMALVHSPFIHPPELEALARSKYPDDLDRKTRAFGHMVTYMDRVVGNILARLKKHGIDRNTLVLFTGDNATGKPITSRLAGMSLKGGNHQGLRDRLIAPLPFPLGGTGPVRCRDRLGGLLRFFYRECA